MASAAAIALGKDDPELLGQLPAIESMTSRALELDEEFSAGDLHTFMISYTMARPGGGDAAAQEARRHFERAVALSGGDKASPYVAMAESVTVAQQKREEFEHLLRTAIELDVDSRPEWRLANRVADRAEIPVRCVAVMRELADAPDIQAIDVPLLRMQRHMLPPWVRPAAESGNRPVPAAPPSPIGVPRYEREPDG